MHIALIITNITLKHQNNPSIMMQQFMYKHIKSLPVPQLNLCLEASIVKLLFSIFRINEQASFLFYYYRN